MSNNLQPLHQTAAEVLAAAVLDLFPKAQLLGGEGTERCFVYDFVLPFTLDQEAVAMIEERMRVRLKLREPIELREMVASNAAELMNSRGQKARATQLRGRGVDLVQVCVIGEFIDVCLHPFEEEWPGALVFKLIEFAALPEHKNGVRLVGVVASQRDELKTKAAALKGVLGRSYVALNEKDPLWQPLEGGWVWTPRGEAVREMLIAGWKRELEGQKISLIATHASDARELEQSHLQYFLRTGQARVGEICSLSSQIAGEGLYAPARYFADRFLVTCSEENLLHELISCLRFIIKIPKMLGFEFQLALSHGPKAKGIQKGPKRRFLKEALEKMGNHFMIEGNAAGDQAARVEVRLLDHLGRSPEFNSGVDDGAGPFLSLQGSVLLNGKPHMVLTGSALGAIERTMALLLECSSKGPEELMKTWSESSEPEN